MINIIVRKLTLIHSYGLVIPGREKESGYGSTSAVLGGCQPDSDHHWEQDHVDGKLNNISRVFLLLWFLYHEPEFWIRTLVTKPRTGSYLIKHCIFSVDIK